MSKNSCRGEHCSPVPVCTSGNAPGRRGRRPLHPPANSCPTARGLAALHHPTTTVGADSISARALSRAAHIRGGVRSPRPTHPLCLPPWGQTPPVRGRWRVAPEGEQVAPQGRMRGGFTAGSPKRVSSASLPLQHNGATSRSTALYSVPKNPVRQSASVTAALSFSISARSRRTSSSTAPP